MSFLKTILFKFEMFFMYLTFIIFLIGCILIGWIRKSGYTFTDFTPYKRK